MMTIEYWFDEALKGLLHWDRKHPLGGYPSRGEVNLTIVRVSGDFSLNLEGEAFTMFIPGEIHPDTVLEAMSGHPWPEGSRYDRLARVRGGGVYSSYQKVLDLGYPDAEFGQVGDVEGWIPLDHEWVKA